MKKKILSFLAGIMLFSATIADAANFGPATNPSAISITTMSPQLVITLPVSGPALCEGGFGLLLPNFVSFQADVFFVGEGDVNYTVLINGVPTPEVTAEPQPNWTFRITGWGFTNGPLSSVKLVVTKKNPSVPNITINANYTAMVAYTSC